MKLPIYPRSSNSSARSQGALTSHIPILSPFSFLTFLFALRPISSARSKLLLAMAIVSTNSDIRPALTKQFARSDCSEATVAARSMHCNSISRLRACPPKLRTLLYAKIISGRTATLIASNSAASPSVAIVSHEHLQEKGRSDHLSDTEANHVEEAASW